MTGDQSAFLVLLVAALGVWASSSWAQTSSSEKLSDDPTKIVTKVGVRYSDFGTVFGSIAFGPVTKINVSVSEDDQWRIGGSYLFEFGIVNVSASEQELDSGVTQTQYAIGTFVPLVALGIQPGAGCCFPPRVPTTRKETPAGLISISPMLSQPRFPAKVAMSAC